MHHMKTRVPSSILDSALKAKDMQWPKDKKNIWNFANEYHANLTNFKYRNSRMHKKARNGGGVNKSIDSIAQFKSS
jgi:hypothetical protein